MTYPIGHPVRRIGATPRHGVLTRPWQRIGDFPCVRWDDGTEDSPLPECVEPIEAEEDQPAPVAVGDTSAWDNYRPAARRARR